MNIKESAKRAEIAEQRYQELVATLPKLMTALIDATCTFIVSEFEVRYKEAGEKLLAEQIQRAVHEQFLSEIAGI